VEALYRALFLTAEDVPGLEPREAVHGEGADPGDTVWVPCRGIKAGFQVWQRLQGTDLTRLVDVRWLFPSEVSAQRYHEARMAANAEGFAPVEEFAVPGAEVAAFSGRDPFGLGGEMRIYLFVLDRVAAKVFVSGLGLEAGVTILKRAAGRIGAALQS
jgi:hypothetical protein